MVIILDLPSLKNANMSSLWRAPFYWNHVGNSIGFQVRTNKTKNSDIFGDQFLKLKQRYKGLLNFINFSCNFSSIFSSVSIHLFKNCSWICLLSIISKKRFWDVLYAVHTSYYAHMILPENFSAVPPRTLYIKFLSRFGNRDVCRNSANEG